MTFVKQPDGSYIEVGSIASIAGKVVDDTKEFSIPVSGIPPVKCEDYTTESECVAAGCYWHYWAEHPEGACYKEPPEIVCSSYTTESTCTAAGCHWYDGKCHSKPKEVEIPWIVILAAVGGTITLIGVALALRR